MLPSFIFAQGVQHNKAPVFIGFDGAYGQKTNTAPIAIEAGIQQAIKEINASGGVLNGRPLELIKSDNKGVSARGKDNFIDFSINKDLVAVLGGKYSPITVEMLPESHRLSIPLISVWGSADQITDNTYKPSYAFRVSLKDSWGVEAMMRRLSQKFKAKQVCAILPNTAWGRSADNVIKSKSHELGQKYPVIYWYNWGDSTFKLAYKECQGSKSEGILFVGNEKEGAILFKEIAQLPIKERLPVISHWGVSGGAIHELVGADLDKINFEAIQTFTFIDNSRPQAKKLGEQIIKTKGLRSVSEIQSPVGVAQAYDATHLIALAINKAKSTDGVKIRDALEALPNYQGAIRDYSPAFTKIRHDALTSNDVIFVRINSNGQLVPSR